MNIKDLVGRNVLDCHPEPTRSNLQKSLDNQTALSYIKEQGGVKKFICQAPWYKEGRYMGLVAMMMVIQG